MEIKQIKIKKLHGYMEKYVVFNKDINILVGINGSGKTSILNVISMILEPSIEDLCLLDFEEIEIEFFVENNFNKILCKKNEKKFTFEVMTEGKILPKLTIVEYKDSIPHFQNNSKDRFFQPVGDELITWKYIRNIPKPIIIGLDRNIIKERRGDFVSDDKDIISKFNSLSTKNPISDVRTLVKRNCLEYQSELKKLDDEFTDYIVQSTFDSGKEYTISKNFFSETKRKSLQKRLKILIDMKNTFENKKFQDLIIKLENQREKIDSLFKKLKQGDENASYNIIINISQLERIEDVLGKIEKYSEERDKRYEKLKKYFETVNTIFKNSNKEIYFDYLNNDIFYKVLGEDKNKIFDSKVIETLSSGEKQILILFTLVTFNRDNRIFIIDEPELSLHPKWQEIFLENIKATLNENVQLIIATHSPGIVGKNKKYCKVLIPLGGDINEV